MISSCELIQQIQDGDNDALLYLLEKYTPLLKRAARQISCEDSYDEVQLRFIILMKTIDLSKIKNTSDYGLSSYIKHSIDNVVKEYWNKSMKQRNQQYLDDLNQFDQKTFEQCSSTKDSYDSLLLADLKKILTPLEYQIINDLFLHERSALEIANQLNVTRQAVNSVKLNALRKLRKAFT